MDYRITIPSLGLDTGKTSSFDSIRNPESKQGESNRTMVNSEREGEKEKEGES